MNNLATFFHILEIILETIMIFSLGIGEPFRVFSLNLSPLHSLHFLNIPLLLFFFLLFDGLYISVLPFLNISAIFRPSEFWCQMLRFFNFDVNYSMTVTRIEQLFCTAPHSPFTYDHRQHLFCYSFVLFYLILFFNYFYYFDYFILFFNYFLFFVFKFF